MKESIARAWIAELRSGRHTQGRGRLECADGRLCCLGVLRKYVLHRECYRLALLQLEDAVESGMKDTSGLFHTDEGHYITLADKNDVEGLTFAQIADIIEAHWPHI